MLRAGGRMGYLSPYGGVEWGEYLCLATQLIKGRGKGQGLGLCTHAACMPPSWGLPHSNPN